MLYYDVQHRQSISGYEWVSASIVVQSHRILPFLAISRSLEGLSRGIRGVGMGAEKARDGVLPIYRESTYLVRTGFERCRGPRTTLMHRYAAKRPDHDGQALIGLLLNGQGKRLRRAGAVTEELVMELPYTFPGSWDTREWRGSDASQQQSFLVPGLDQPIAVLTGCPATYAATSRVVRYREVEGWVRPSYDPAVAEVTLKGLGHTTLPVRAVRAAGTSIPLSCIHCVASRSVSQ